MIVTFWTTLSTWLFQMNKSIASGDNTSTTTNTNQDFQPYAANSSASTNTGWWRYIVFADTGTIRDDSYIDHLHMGTLSNFKGVTWFHRCVIHTLLKVHIGKINKELFEFFKNIDFWLRYADYANYVNCSMSHVKK